MSEATRFDLDMDGSMEPSDNGRWVRFEDYAALRSRVAALEAAREREHERFLMWRAIEDTPCKDCTGSGVKLYGSTSTWRGGAGGQTVTTAVCNKCWGSGSAEQPWPSWGDRP